jgi:hypothetical protein
MRVERRQPRPGEWQHITSSRPVVRRVVLPRTNLTRREDECLKAPKGGGGR